MSVLAASILGLLLYTAALLPVVWAATQRAGRDLMAVYSAAILLLCFYQTGFLEPSPIRPSDATLGAVGPTQQEQCKQVVELMRRLGLSIDRSDATAPKLVGRGADSVPPEVRNVLIGCATNSAQ